MEKPESTMNREVSRVVFHTGVQIGTTVHNSLDTIKHNVHMRLCEHGVLIKHNDTETVVGMADILTVRLA